MKSSSFPSSPARRALAASLLLVTLTGAPAQAALLGNPPADYLDHTFADSGDAPVRDTLIGEGNVVEDTVAGGHFSEGIAPSSLGRSLSYEWAINLASSSVLRITDEVSSAGTLVFRYLDWIGSADARGREAPASLVGADADSLYDYIAAGLLNTSGFADIWSASFNASNRPTDIVGVTLPSALMLLGASLLAMGMESRRPH